MRKQERVRFIMLVAIVLLIAAVFVLFAMILSKKSCSNTTGKDFLNDSEVIIGSDKPSGDPVKTAEQETPTPGLIDDPTEEPTKTPEVTPTPAVLPGNIVDPGNPTIPQSPYPSIPYLVTEGSFADVKARLEQLKTLPSSATIVLVDVGHGGFDGGTVGIDTSKTEADVNLEIAREVGKWLASKGYYVFLTRMGDYAVGTNKNADMKWRKAVMKLDIFDISISIHQNALDTDRSVCGARIYCYKKGTAGENLAKAVIETVTAVSDTARKNVYTGNLMVVREPICPSILVECGFLSNHDEELLLQNPAYQRMLGKAIADGAINYLNQH